MKPEGACGSIISKCTVCGKEGLRRSLKCPECGGEKGWFCRKRGFWADSEDTCSNCRTMTKIPSQKELLDKYFGADAGSTTAAGSGAGGGKSHLPSSAGSSHAGSTPCEEFVWRCANCGTTTVEKPEYCDTCNENSFFTYCTHYDRKTASGCKASCEKDKPKPVPRPERKISFRRPDTPKPPVKPPPIYDIPKVKIPAPRPKPPAPPPEAKKEDESGGYCGCIIISIGLIIFIVKVIQGCSG